MSIADKYRKELARIRREEGTLQVGTVIERARNPNSPLYDYYNWDLEQSAMEHWKTVTRELITSFYRVTVNEIDVSLRVKIPEYVHDPDLANKTGGGYIESISIKDDPDKAGRSVLERARPILSQIETLLNLTQMWNLPDAADLLTLALRPMVDLVELYKSDDDEAEPPPAPAPRRPRRGGGGSENRLRP